MTETYNKSAHSVQPEMVTVDELAEQMRVDRKTLYAAIRRRELPGVVRLGRVVRIHAPTFMNWIRSSGTAAL
jgi:excisionase family DNA binding protein